MGSTSEFGFIRLGCGHTFELDDEGLVVDGRELICSVRGTGWTSASATAVVIPYVLYVDSYSDELILEDYDIQAFQDVEVADHYIEDFEWDGYITCICPNCGHEEPLDAVSVFRPGGWGGDEENVELTVAQLDPEDNLASFFAELAQKAA